MSDIRDQLITDLCAKVSEDIRGCVRRTTSLAPDAAAMFAISVAAAAHPIGSATGFAVAMAKQMGATGSEEEILDALWCDILRPMALKAAGGSYGDFRALLRKCRDAKAAA